MKIIDQETIVGKVGEFAEIIRTARLMEAGDHDHIKVVFDEGYLSVKKINGFKAYHDSKYVPGQRPPSDDEQPADIIEH